MADLHLQLRRKNSTDPVLLEYEPFAGEPVFEIDTGKLKIGDGSRKYKDLPYVGTGGSGTSDYNALENKPITNYISGNFHSIDSVLILSSLSDGYYLVSGLYKVSSVDIERTFGNNKTLVKVVDKTNGQTHEGKKIISFELFEEDGTSDIHVFVVTFTNLGSEIIESQEDSKYAQTAVISVDTLPTVAGKKDAIYAVSGQGLYVYKDDSFHQLGEPCWVKDGF